MFEAEMCLGPSCPQSDGLLRNGIVAHPKPRNVPAGRKHPNAIGRDDIILGARGSRRSSLEFSVQATPGSPALKLIPPQGRLIVLPSDRVRVNLRRRPHRGVPQALRHHRQRHAISQQVRPVAVAQGVQARALGKTEPAAVGTAAVGTAAVGKRWEAVGTDETFPCFLESSVPFVALNCFHAESEARGCGGGAASPHPAGQCPPGRVCQ